MDKNHDEQRYVYIDFLKVVAMVLVFNSHLDSIYPMPQLATGGALGNSLFFICTGFLFKINNEKFVKWFIHKLFNLYLPVYIMLLFLNVTHIVNSKENLVNDFIWPTHYWFVGAIIIFYLLLYVIERYDLAKYTYLFVALLIGAYAVIYIFVLDTSFYVVESNGLETIQGCFKLIYYFIITLIGYYIRNFKGKNKYSRKTYLCIAIVTAFLLYSVKIFESRSSFWMHFQFAEQLMVCIFSVSALLFGINDNFWKDSLTERIKTFLAKLSSYSLYSYLVHFSVIEVCEKIFSFPVSLIIVIIVTCICAYALAGITSWIKNKLLWLGLLR